MSEIGVIRQAMYKQERVEYPHVPKQVLKQMVYDSMRKAVANVQAKAE